MKIATRRPVSTAGGFALLSMSINLRFATGVAVFVLAATLAFGWMVSGKKNGSGHEESPTVKEHSVNRIASLPKHDSIGNADSFDAGDRVDGVAVEDYGALLDEALTLRDVSRSNELLRVLLLKWIEKDQSSLLEALDERSLDANLSPALWERLIPVFEMVLPKITEDAAMRPELPELVQWMAEKYAESDPRAALQWANEWLMDATRQEALAVAAGELAASDIAAATALLDDIQSGTERMEAIGRIAAKLTAQNADAGLKWAQTLPVKRDRIQAVQEALWAMAEVDPILASQALLASDYPREAAAASEEIARQLALQFPEQGIRWAESLPESMSRDEAIAGAIAGYAAGNPKGALAYWQAHQPENAEIGRQIFETWAESAPVDAMQTASQLANPQARLQAAEGIINAWPKNSDVDGLERWIDSLPAGHERDHAAAAMVGALSFEQPGPSWQRALTIRDRDLRSQALYEAFDGLVEKSPTEAQAALGKASLSPQDLNRLSTLLP